MISRASLCLDFCLTELRLNPQQDRSLGLSECRSGRSVGHGNRNVLFVEFPVESQGTYCGLEDSIMLELELQGILQARRASRVMFARHVWKTSCLAAQSSISGSWLRSSSVSVHSNNVWLGTTDTSVEVFVHALLNVGNDLGNCVPLSSRRRVSVSTSTRSASNPNRRTDEVHTKTVTKSLTHERTKCT